MLRILIGTNKILDILLEPGEACVEEIRMTPPAAEALPSPSLPRAQEAPIVIRAFEPGDAAAFYALNEQWISRHFGMEERDHLNLGDPQRSILDPGGHILIAVAGDRAVGCCALIPEHKGEFELAKMAVAEEMRGRGLGRRILTAAVDLARSLGAHRLTLGSNTKLSDAVHLYESIGFTHVPADRRPPSLYARADVFMEMSL